MKTVPLISTLLLLLCLLTSAVSGQQQIVSGMCTITNLALPLLPEEAQRTELAEKIGLAISSQLTGATPLLVSVKFSSVSVATAVYTFTVNGVDAAVTAQATLSSWAATPSTPAVNGIKTSFTSLFGSFSISSTTLVTFAGHCTHSGSPLPSPAPAVDCETDFYVELITSVPPDRTSVAGLICTALNWGECPLTVGSSTATSNGRHSTPIAFKGKDPRSTVVALVSKAPVSSHMVQLDVVGISVQGVPVYLSDTLSQSGNQPDKNCLEQAWWLLFVLLLFPLLFICAKRAYVMGRRKGIERGKAEDRERKALAQKEREVAIPVPNEVMAQGAQYMQQQPQLYGGPPQYGQKPYVVETSVHGSERRY